MQPAEKLNKGSLKNEQIDELKKLFRSALDDGRISTKELAQIQFFYYDSELSESDFTALKENVFREVVESVIADHQVTEQEHATILRIAKQLNISQESREWAKEQVGQFSAVTTELGSEDE